MIARWLEVLASFNFTVLHRAGASHGNADALSRIKHAEAADPEGADSKSVLGIHPPEYPPSLNSLGQEMHALGNRILTAAMTKKLYLPAKSEILMAQQNDNILVQVRGWLRTLKPPDGLVHLSLSPETQLYADIFDDLFLDSVDILGRVTDPTAHSIPVSHRICIPSDLQAMIIESAHVTGGHMAAQKTLVRVNRTCYFPGMKRIVAEFVLRCRSCQSKSNKMDSHQTGTLASVQAGFPFQRISIDFVGPLAASSKGNKYILTVKDCLTRWIEAFPIVAATALETVDILVKEIFCRYGVPEIIRSDRGNQFTSNLFHSVAREYSIQVTTTPAYNPKSNPVKRVHRDLGTMLRALSYDTHQDWEALLPPGTVCNQNCRL
jgi:hypothetical protein